MISWPSGVIPVGSEMTLHSSDERQLSYCLMIAILSSEITLCSLGSWDGVESVVVGEMEVDFSAWLRLMSLIPR